MSARLLASAQSFVAGLLALGRTRLELFSTELQEEMARQAALLLGALATILVVGMGAAFGGLALILAVDESQRAGMALGVAGFFAALAIGAAWTLRKLLRTKPRAFDASLAQLEHDYEALNP